MGFVGCGGGCVFDGLWIVEVVGCGGGFRLFCGLWLMMTVGCRWFYWVAVGCFIGQQWVVGCGGWW